MSEKECLAHESRIAALETTIGELVPALKDNTKAINNFVTQLAVMVAKYDRVEADQKEVKKQADENAKAIANMKPTVEALRKLAWQMIGYSLIGGGAVAAIATALTAMAGK